MHVAEVRAPQLHLPEGLAREREPRSVAAATVITAPQGTVTSRSVPRFGGAAPAGLPCRPEPQAGDVAGI